MPSYKLQSSRLVELTVSNIMVQTPSWQWEGREIIWSPASESDYVAALHVRPGAVDRLILIRARARVHRNQEAFHLRGSTGENRTRELKNIAILAVASAPKTLNPTLDSGRWRRLSSLVTPTLPRGRHLRCSAQYSEDADHATAGRYPVEQGAVQLGAAHRDGGHWRRAAAAAERRHRRKGAPRRSGSRQPRPHGIPDLIRAMKF
jgi:hypothetical protein